MRKLILLTGLHKTGTTSIQHSCYRNVELLKRAGFAYPVTVSPEDKASRAVETNHSKVIQYLFRQRIRTLDGQEYSGNTTLEKDHVRHRFDQYLQAEKDNDLILAAEACSTLSTEELGDLKHWFNERDFEVRVFCCVRRPSAWLSSIMAQRVSGRRGPKLSLGAAIEQFRAAGSIVMPRILNLRQVFPDACFYSFDAAANHRLGPPGYFLERIGIEPQESFVPTRENVGVSDPTVRLHSLINEELGHRYQSEQSYVFHLHQPRKYPYLFALPGPKFSLRNHEMQPLLPLLEKENAWLKAQFGEGFYDPEIHFSRAPVSPPDETRDYLLEHARAAGPRVRQAIDRYLALV